MKRFTKLIATLALGVLAVACVTPEGPNVIQPGDGPVLKIEAAPAGDFTRATDTAFEQGDAFGLFAIKGAGFKNLTPDNFANVLFSLESWITNAKYTKGQSGFTGDQEYKWYEGDEVSSFVGLYPYISGVSAGEVLFEGIDFCVKSDQSTHAGYTASDLMGAYKDGVAPTDQAVTLSFNHLLSKVVVDIDNQTGEVIKDVYVDGVRGNLSYSLVSLQTTGDYGTIKAGELANANNSTVTSFALIIPPQSATPKVAITTASDKQYTFEAPNAIEFGVAKERHITITITPTSVSTNFDAIVNDWSADESIEFKDQPGVGPGDDPVVDEASYKVIVGNDEYTLEKNNEGGWGTILLPVFADVNEFQIVNTDTGATLGGQMLSSGMNIGLTEGVEKVTLPKVELYTEYELTLVTEGEGAPYLKMLPIKVGEFDTYLGRGMVVEGVFVGIMNPVDVLADAKGRYLFFTPMEAIAQTAVVSAPDKFAMSESADKAASPYIILTTEQKVYNGWNYIECAADSVINTGLQVNVNGTWGNWNYLRTVNDEGQVPYNRSVDAAGKVYQLNFVHMVSNVGILASSGNENLLFVLPGGSINDRKYEMVGASNSLSDDGTIVNMSIFADRDVSKISYALFNKLNIDNQTCREVVEEAINQGLMSERTLEQNGEDKGLGLSYAPSGSGGFTLLVAGYNAAGELCSTAYTSFDFVAPNSGVPCKNIEMIVKLDEVRPDTQLTFGMIGTNITSAYYSCLPADQFGGLSDNQLKDAALVNNYGYLTGYLDFVNDTGYTESIVGLQPSTEYVVFGWFEDSDGGYTFIRNNITTAAATEWTLLGQGMYYDGSWQLSNEGALGRYGSEVNIYQAADGKAHYRIEEPYKNFCVNNPNLTSGSYSTYFEVAVYPMVSAAGESVWHLCYDAHETGVLATYTETNDSVLWLEHPYNTKSTYQKYPMRDMGSVVSAYTNSHNRKLNDGVLQIQPWYMLSAASGIGYNYTQATETIIVTLPGYTFEFTPTEEDTTTQGVAAKSGARRGLKNSPAMVPMAEGGRRGDANTPLTFNHRVKVGEVKSLGAEKSIILAE